jgi:hypothetical protein
MSTIKVDNLQTTGGAGLYPARAWGNFTNVGGPSLRRSGNVSSLIDITTNSTEVNFTNGMTDTSYAIAAAEQHASSTVHSNFYICHWRNVTTSKISQMWYSTDSNQLGFCVLS